jgi:hypothetical protein
MPKSSLIVEPGEILKSFEATEARLWADRWLCAFGQDGLGVNTGAFMWHVFSSNRYPSISAQTALDAYHTHEATAYIVHSNKRDAAVSTVTKPETCDASDYYVFPENLAWTLAMTHENGWLGPYFAFHKDYERLNQMNVKNYQAYLRKQKELAIAHAKGWV